MRKTLFISQVTICTALLSACATTGGFEPVRKELTSFNEGATAGKVYVAAREEKILDTKYLELLRWHTAYLPSKGNNIKYSTGASIIPSDFNDSRLLQPNDSFSSSKSQLEDLAMLIVCTGQIDDDQGSLLMRSADEVAKKLKKFDFEPSDKSLDNLKLLLGVTEAKPVTLTEKTDEEISGEVVKNIARQKNNSLESCKKDFRDTKNLGLAKTPPIKTDNSIELSLIHI